MAGRNFRLTSSLLFFYRQYWKNMIENKTFIPKKLERYFFIWTFSCILFAVNITINSFLTPLRSCCDSCAWMQQIHCLRMSSYGWTECIVQLDGAHLGLTLISIVSFTLSSPRDLATYPILCSLNPIHVRLNLKEIHI